MCRARPTGRNYRSERVRSKLSWRYSFQAGCWHHGPGQHGTQARDPGLRPNDVRLVHASSDWPTAEEPTRARRTGWAIRASAKWPSAPEVCAV